VDARHEGGAAKDEDGDDAAGHVSAFVVSGEGSPRQGMTRPGERERRVLSTGDWRE